MLLYNIHVLPAHQSNDFVATHALGHINLSQHAFSESKASLSFVRLLFFVDKKGILRFLSSNFLCIFWMLVKPLQKIPMLVRLSFCKLLATHGLNVLSISYREWPIVVSFYEVLLIIYSLYLPWQITDKLENESLGLINVTLSCNIWCIKNVTLKLTLVEVESIDRFSPSQKAPEDPPSLHRLNFYHSKYRFAQFFEILVFHVLDYRLSNFVVVFYEHLVKSR